MHSIIVTRKLVWFVYALVSWISEQLKVCCVNVVNHKNYGGKI